jgi:alanine racemase
LANDEFEKRVLRPSWVQVDLDAVAGNVKNIRKYLGQVKFLAVVKADAYGLGAIPVAKTIVENGADMLGVVMLEEAIELRQAGIKAPILNMGPISPSQAEYVLEYDLEQIVFTRDVAAALSNASVKKDKLALVHLKVDTGMSRYGVYWNNVLGEFRQLQLPGLSFVGAMSHFPMSDAIDKSFALLQIYRMKELRKSFERGGIEIPVWHICNSGGALDLPEAHLDMVRIGLMNYGYFPSSDVRRPFALTPAMQVKTKIISLRTIQRGDTVGYGRRFMAEKEEKIAVLPIGYADGYERRLRNVGQVIVRGQKVPIVGGLCMDACFIKVTEVPDVQIGDIVTLMGRDGDEEISPHDIGGWIQSVSYDVMCKFGKRLPRVYLKNGEIIGIRNVLLNSMV